MSFKQFFEQANSKDPKYRDHFDLVKAFREEAIKLSVKDSKAKKRKDDEEVVDSELLEDEAMTFISDLADDLKATTYKQIRDVLKDVQ